MRRLLLAAGLLLAAPRASAADTGSTETARPLPTPIDALGANVIDAVSSPNLLYFGAAAAATGTMAFVGADHQIRLVFQRHLPSTALADTALYGGYVLPIAVAPGIYAIGLLSGDRVVAGAGAAAIQALALTAVATGTLKWVTGRPYPTHGGDPRDPSRLEHDEYARQFSFDLFDGGRGLAWPSGHTSASISIAAALTAYYPERTWIPVVSYPVSLLIGIGMIGGDHHWASDVVGGALIGHVIGYSVGRGMRRVHRERATRAAWPGEVRVAPLAGAAFGIVVSIDN